MRRPYSTGRTFIFYKRDCQNLQGIKKLKYNLVTIKKKTNPKPTISKVNTILGSQAKYSEVILSKLTQHQVIFCVLVVAITIKFNILIRSQYGITK